MMSGSLFGDWPHIGAGSLGSIRANAWMPSSSFPLCFAFGTGYQPTAFSPPLSDFHFQSTITTMRTSPIVAFICLAMGVAPSFSLPSISLRRTHSLKSGGRDHVGTSQNGSNSGQRPMYHDYPKYPPNTLVSAGIGPEKSLQDFQNQSPRRHSTWPPPKLIN
ncbi:hypothetical protein F5148DRAFT_214829 [Russula earlei]|uniref:Uncharacterized protein n=1 Tax=Russula earlei TaxID=71964 RepID=A0ACC0U5A0_9AGAM|nr:hypothetical protein F5148DRAFT_214829 [Russula earlei]